MMTTEMTREPFFSVMNKDLLSLLAKETVRRVPHLHEAAAKETSSSLDNLEQCYDCTYTIEGDRGTVSHCEPSPVFDTSSVQRLSPADRGRVGVGSTSGYQEIHLDASRGAFRSQLWLFNNEHHLGRWWWWP